MSDWLQSIGREAAQEEQMSNLEQELAAYTTGELSARRQHELEVEAERDPVLRTALEAHRPLDAAERSAIISAIVGAAPAASAGAAAGSGASVGGRRPARAQARAAARWHWVGAAVAPLLMAAGLALWLRPASEAQREWTPYSLEVRGDALGLRSAPAPAKVVALRWLLGGTAAPALLLRPSRATSAELESSVFLLGSEPSAASAPVPLEREWPHRAQVSSEGAMLLTLEQVSELPAQGQLSVVLRDREAPPARELALGAAAEGPGWQRWQVQLEPQASDAER